jgi:hypothetical protein
MAGTIRGRQEEDRGDSERDEGGGDERVEGIAQKGVSMEAARRSRCTINPLRNGTIPSTRAGRRQSCGNRRGGARAEAGEDARRIESMASSVKGDRWKQGKGELTAMESEDMTRETHADRDAASTLGGTVQAHVRRIVVVGYPISNTSVCGAASVPFGRATGGVAPGLDIRPKGAGCVRGYWQPQARRASTTRRQRRSRLSVR